MAIASPNPLNYAIGKGNCFIRLDGELDFRHVGNVPEFEFTPEIEKLDHFESMSGVKSKDRSVTLSKSGTLRMVMEEITAENMAIALLGTISEGSSGDQEIEIFAQAAVRCEVKFVGSNDVGARMEWYFRRVEFIPSSSVSPISDEWGRLEVSGEVSAVNGSFGTVTKFRDGQ